MIERKTYGPWTPLLAAVLAAGGLLCAYALFGVAPFGDLTILHGDMNTQYARYYAYLMRALRGQESLLYSFHAGLGGSMLPTFTYYLASPFSLLALFFSESQIPEMLMIMTVLKVGAMAATFTVFARVALRDRSLLPVPAALCFALCGYVVGYASNIMWLDALILMPLVLASCTKMARGEGSWGLVLWLALLFFTQFYLAYMVGIFAFLWLVCALFVLRTPHKLRKILALIGWAVLAAGCCAATLLPTALRLLGNAAFVDATPAPTWQSLYDARQLLSRAFFGVYDTIMGKPASMPPLYAGTLTVLLLPVYLSNSGISWRERLCTGLMSVFLLVCMALPPLTRAWHAFDEAAWFQFRFAFLLVFVWVFAGLRCLQQLSTARWWVLAVTGGGLALYFFMEPIALPNTDYRVSTLLPWLLGGWTAAGVGLILWGRRDAQGAERPLRAAAACLLAAVLLAELICNAYLILESTAREIPFTAASDFREERQEVTALLAKLPEEGDAPYRLEYLQQDLPNSGIFYGTKGQQFYSTALQRELSQALNAMGYFYRAVYQGSLGHNIAADSLLGVRFVLAEDSPNAYYHPEAQQGDLSAYENDFTFPLAFVASRDALDFSFAERPLDHLYYAYYFKATNSFEELNRMFQALAGDDALEIFVQLPLDDYALEGLTVEPTQEGGWILRSASPEEGGTITYHVRQADLDAPVYGMFRLVHEADASAIELDGTTLYEPQTAASPRIYYIGQFEPEEEIPLSYRYWGGEALLDAQWLYALDTDALWDLGGEFYGSSLENIQWENTRITGTATAGGEDLLFLSVPYDGGWSATVDGQPVEVQRALSIFLGIPLEAGEHQVVLTYRPVGFRLGLMISGISLLGVGLVLILRDLLEKRGKRKAGRA